MAIRPNEEERSFGADRERQRMISNESARMARPSGGENVARADDASESESAQHGRSNRGFASMEQKKQREIASKGGRAAHEKGTAHEFDAGEARAAGRKGGVAVSKDREHMAAIGRRGGEARGANRAARLQSHGSEAGGALDAGQKDTTRLHTDREVGIDGNSPQQRAGNAPAPRPSGNSLGGEPRSASHEDRNVERP